MPISTYDDFDVATSIEDSDLMVIQTSTGGMKKATIPFLKQNIGTVGLTDAPSDNAIYGRKNAAWAEVTIPTASGGITQFTYLVDSDQTLADWANNVAGNDYTAVLIKAPSNTSGNGYRYNCNKTINLSTTKTNVVVSMPEVIVQFNNVENCFIYDEVITTSDYYGTNILPHCYMQGVNVELYNYDQMSEQPPVTYVYCFMRCNNLYNCNVKIVGIIDSALEQSEFGMYAYGFGSCNKLVNCSVDIDISSKDDYVSSGQINLNAMGYAQCNDLLNCDINNITLSAKNSKSYTFGSHGFSLCTLLNNCHIRNMTINANADGTNIFDGMSGCINITNCTGNISASNTGTGNILTSLIKDSTNINNYTGELTFSSDNTVYIRGVNNCQNISNCNIDIFSGAVSTQIFGFRASSNISNCTVNINSTYTAELLTAASAVVCYYNCYTLSSCIGYCTCAAIQNIFAFNTCVGIICCNGTVKHIYTGNDPYICLVYGQCSGMLMNDGTNYTITTSGVYYTDCYVELTGGGTTLVANTAAGGWNAG
jgi:hypothetical protein